jgi:hypothetical protein
MATAFDVPSEGSLSLNGKATMYRPSFVRRTWSWKCSSYVLSDSDKCVVEGPSSSSQKRLIGLQISCVYVKRICSYLCVWTPPDDPTESSLL